jgi:hypothetical protein
MMLQRTVRKTYNVKQIMTRIEKIRLKPLRQFILYLLVAFFTLCQVDIHNPMASEATYWQGLNVEKAIHYPDGWFYTLEEITNRYDIEYNAGKRLSNSIREKNGNYITSCNSDDIIVPEAFIRQSLKMIQDLLEQGLARFIFRLDAFHGHLFVPEQIFMQKYKHMETQELIKVFMHEKTLGILFHNAEHLALHNPPNSDIVDVEALELVKKRNVIGWYDGRPLEVIMFAGKDILADRKSATASIPEGYRNVGVITFKAVRTGEFSITHNGKEIRIDISPYECYYY